MTEEEAKTKWCPFARDVDGAPTTNCIGSACMAWRWDHDIYRESPYVPRYVPSETEGHCGLAEKP